MEVRKKFSDSTDKVKTKYEGMKDSRLGDAVSDVREKLVDVAEDVADNIEFDVTTTENTFVRVKVYYKERIVGEYDIEEDDVDDFIEYIKDIRSEDVEEEQNED